MPSKTSKKQRVQPSPWKVAPACSESGLRQIAQELAHQIQAGDWILLDGEMGVGKSTFAHELLASWGVGEHSEGSPTFAIAHEYFTRVGLVIHLDLYRLQSDLELEEAGVFDYFWGREGIVISEWVSQFSELETKLYEDQMHRKWLVKLEYVSSRPLERKIEIRQLS